MELQRFRKPLLNTTSPHNVRAAAARGLLRTALLVGEQEGAEALQQLLKLVQQQAESPALRLAVLETAAVCIRAHNVQAVMGGSSRVFQDAAYRPLCDAVWALCTTTTSLGSCQQLRLAAQGLYQAIWGLEWPACCEAAPEGLILGRKQANVAEAPQLSFSTHKGAQQLGWRGIVPQTLDASFSALDPPGPPPAQPPPKPPTPTPAPAAPASSLKLTIPLSAAAATAAEPQLKKAKTEDNEEGGGEIVKQEPPQ